MSAEERKFRSQLAQLIDQRGMLRGTLLLRRRVCGKPTCKCARGAKHESLYLIIREGGRRRHVFIPRDWEGVVRQWAADYRRAKGLMDEICRLHCEKVRRRQG